MYFLRTNKTWVESLSGELKYSDRFILININHIVMIEASSKRPYRETQNIVGDLWKVILSSGEIFYIADYDMEAIDKCIVSNGRFIESSP